MYTVTFEMQAAILFEIKGKLWNIVVRVKSTGYTHNKINMDAFTYTATVALRGYHVYKATSWINAKVGDKVTEELETAASSLETDPYAFAIKIKDQYFSNLKSDSHV